MHSSRFILRQRVKHILISIQNARSSSLYSSANPNSLLSTTAYKGESNLNEVPSEKKQVPHPVDGKLLINRLRNSFASPGPGLSLAKNRQDLVAEFYDLTKSVAFGEISIEDFEKSNTMRLLHEEINLHIDTMSNAQIVNILASLIKMKANPSLKLVKLLEHEIKFRIDSLTGNQVMKLVKFYNSTEMSYEQKQMTDMLNNRIRSTVCSDNSSLEDLVAAYKSLVKPETKPPMLAQVEERLLNILTDQEVDDLDNILGIYIPLDTSDYSPLCNLFVALASAKRRPTPLLKAAAAKLSSTTLPSIEGPGEITATQMLSTLNALVSLNFINRTLTSKLVEDLTSKINLKDMDTVGKCDLLRTLNSLKWRSQSLMDKLYDYLDEYKGDVNKVDFNFIHTLIYVTAQLNYKPKQDLKELYSNCMNHQRIQLVDQYSRKWLNHVWSLTILGIDEKAHIDSVLNGDFIKRISTLQGGSALTHADKMKLLNLGAISLLEYKSHDASHLLKDFSSQPIQRGKGMAKFSASMKEALNGMVGDERALRHEKQTPFGFIVDCELMADENSNFLPLEHSRIDQISELSSFSNNEPAKRYALIYILFDETISNSPGEPLGHRRIASRIMGDLGYQTVFIPETVMAREKTSADISNRIRSLVFDKN